MRENGWREKEQSERSNPYHFLRNGLQTETSQNPRLPDPSLHASHKKPTGSVCCEIPNMSTAFITCSSSKHLVFTGRQPLYSPPLLKICLGAQVWKMLIPRDTSMEQQWSNWELPAQETVWHSKAQTAEWLCILKDQLSTVRRRIWKIGRFARCSWSHSDYTSALGTSCPKEKVFRQREQLVSAVEHIDPSLKKRASIPMLGSLCQASLVVAEEGNCWVTLVRAKFLFMPYQIRTSLTNCKPGLYMLCYVQGRLIFFILTALEEY